MESGEYDLVIATQDWHPADHRSFASNNPGKEVYDLIDLEGLPQCMWPDHCVEGSPGAELREDLRRDLIDHVVQKGGNRNIDSYSGFCENDHRTATGLHEYIMEQALAAGCLNPQEIELHVCGLALDYCVKFTALDAAELGYQTSLVVDVCRAVNLNPGDDRRTLAELEEAGVQVTRSIAQGYPRERLGVGQDRGIGLSA